MFLLFDDDDAELPAGGYAAWAAALHAERAVLCDLQAAQKLEGWVSDIANVYRSAWSRHLTDVPTAGGILVQLDGVKENSTLLTERASVALVSANAGSWYYDHAASLIYVHTTSGADPDTFSFFGPYFSFTLATTAKGFDGGPLYDPRLTDQSLPSVQARQEDFLSGLIAYPFGELAINNADGLFDRLSTALYWEGYKATFWIGGDPLGSAEYGLMATMVIAQQPSASDDIMRVALRSVTKVLNVAIPSFQLDDIWGSSVVSESAGKYFPEAYGTVYDIPLILIARAGVFSGSSARFASARAVSTVTAVRAVDRATMVRTTLTLVTDYTFGSGFVDVIEASFSPDTYDFVADVGSSQRIGTILTTLLTGAGVAAGEIDSVAMAKADADAPFDLGIYVPELTTIGEVVTKPLRDTLTSLFRAPNGSWTAQVWDPSSDWANVPHYMEQEIAAFSAPPDIREPLAHRVRLRYAHRITSDSWATQTASSGLTEHGRPSSEPLEVDSLLVNAADADLMVERFLALVKQPTLRFDVDLPTSALTLEPMGKIRVTRARAQGGPLDRAVFEVSAFVKRLNNQRMTATIDNQRGLGAVVKRAAPDGTPAWSSATEAQKRTYAFAHDTATERVDVADAATYHHSEAW